MGTLGVLGGTSWDTEQDREYFQAPRNPGPIALICIGPALCPWGGCFTPLGAVTPVGLALGQGMGRAGRPPHGHPRS